MSGTTLGRFVGSSLALLAVTQLAGQQGAQTPEATTSLTVAVTQDGRTTTIATKGHHRPHHATSRVIVRFRSGTSFLSGGGRTKRLSAAANIHMADIPADLSVATAVTRYRQDPNVLYAEPDYSVSTSLTPSDPAYGSKQWDMAKIAAGAAWDLHTDSGRVVVAVMDTGIDFAHPDLAANLYSDAGAPSVHGYTCMNGACVAGGQDDHGHGTHVAGTIGAAASNGVGMAGLNWSVQLLSIKFLGPDGSGSVSDAVLGFNLLRALKLKGVNIRVVNNSWGGAGYSQALKDAMAALEDTPGYPSTLDVCAAGNNGLNADFFPTYPGAFDNRGLVSVLASDATDVGASFSNFGLSSVDIAAPGVSTYSTSPAGNCLLCDPSGYRYLSGSSMAAPHVTGVAAALMDMNPNLTAAQVRDALLRPESYDPVTDLRAASTSTGGRLNFYKVLSNTGFLVNPALNGFPKLSIGPDVFTSGGSTVTLTASASDPDGDALRAVRGRGPVNAGSAWLLGWQATQIFPNAAPFLAPNVARTIAMPYDVSVTDNRGGGGSARNWVIVKRVAMPGGVPTGTLTVPSTGAVGVPISVGFSGLDPEGSTVGWDLWTSGLGASTLNCCYTRSSASLTFSTAGVYRVGVHAIDRELNTSRDYTSVVAIGGAIGIPPIADAVLNSSSGVAPLTVSIDMKGSTDPDGTITAYYVDCSDGSVTASASSAGSCTFNSPGIYWLLLQVRDNDGLMGLTSRYVVVTPPPPVGGTAPLVLPAVSLSPSGTTTVLRRAQLKLTATPNAPTYGIARIDFLVAGKVVGKATASPYAYTWTAPRSAQTISATAKVYDTKGNMSMSNVLTIVVK